MILMKNIIREGHPTLETVAKEVRLPLSSGDKKLLKEMLEFVMNSQDEEMVEKYGLRPAVGIAAPQVGVSKKMFIVGLPSDDEKVTYVTMINPHFIKKSKKKVNASVLTPFAIAPDE